MQVIHFTDPACPYAFSAEPRRLKLEWHYGEQLSWRTVMVGLSRDPAEYLAKGMDPAKMASGMRNIRDTFGMPIDASERQLAASVPACLAVVAARLNAPERADALLRRLRVRTMAGQLLDLPETIEGAAGDVGIEADDLRRWTADPAGEAALAEDMQAARSPHASALVLDHKLADAGRGDGSRRYTCPSYELSKAEETWVAPGMQPWETYDVAVANLHPGIERRGTAKEAAEVLDWASHPLATAEVAALLDVSIDAAREQLTAVAELEPVAQDGYWTLRS